MTDKHEHYKKDVSHLKMIDVYRIIDLYKITDGCFQHALKKMLVPGRRGYKDLKKDIEDIIDSMKRKLEMMEEDNVRERTTSEGVISQVDDNPWGGPYPTAKTLDDATPEEWDAASRRVSKRKHIARRSPSLRYPYHVQSQETVKDPLGSGDEE